MNLSEKKDEEKKIFQQEENLFGKVEIFKMKSEGNCQVISSQKQVLIFDCGSQGKSKDNSIIEKIVKICNGRRKPAVLVHNEPKFILNFFVLFFFFLIFFLLISPIKSQKRSQSVKLFPEES